MSSNHQDNRELQREARAWAKFAGTTYARALKQVVSPLARGLLGEPLSPRQLIAALHDHPVIGDREGRLVLGQYGFTTDASWRPDPDTGFIELALVVDFLRMFTPATAEVSSYSVKHTAERFLAQHCPYVSNGQLIWAAAALGLPTTEPEGDSPNVSIGISEREHDYVSRLVDRSRTSPRGDQYRPAGLVRLQQALQQAAAGETSKERWVRPTPSVDATPFHDWLIDQAVRPDPIGDFATDYAAGVHDSDHVIARTPTELLAILEDLPHSPEAYDAAGEAIREWLISSRRSRNGDANRADETMGVRTVQISGSTSDSEGFGAGSGTVDRYEYRCMCNSGRIVEQHDNIPGFRDHDTWLECDRCRTKWRLVTGRHSNDWELEPIEADTAA